MHDPPLEGAGFELPVPREKASSFSLRSKPGLSADGNHSVGIASGDRVLPTFGDPGGAVGPTDHPMGRRVRPQCDQIRPAGSGIKPAEFARGLRSEPHRTIRRGIDIVRPSPCQHGKGTHFRFSVRGGACCQHQQHRREHRAKSHHGKLLPLLLIRITLAGSRGGAVLSGTRRGGSDRRPPKRTDGSNPSSSSSESGVLVRAVFYLARLSAVVQRPPPAARPSVR